MMARSLIQGPIFAFLSLICFCICQHPPQYYADLPPGPYCEKRGCCSGRLDECAEPILGSTSTLCYCDDFCNSTRVDDCCPDYWTHCRGLTTPPTTTARIRTTPRPPNIEVCTFEGKNYGYQRTVKKNCNVCKCEEVRGKLEMLCETDECLINPTIVETINSDRSFGWTATNYSKFWGKKLQEGIEYRLGTLQPANFVLNMNPVRKIYDPKNLPREFDAEKKWPNLIKGIQDQGWCGSSWAISTAAVASDRFGILSKGYENVKLSAQHLLSCDLQGQQSCKGGQLDRAWQYIRRFGIVNEECFPYVGYNEKCSIPHHGNLLSAKCELPQNVERTSKYKVAPAYRLGNETDIMYEILKSGPVQATMLVKNDFFTYQNGIYKHSSVSESPQVGFLSVRIVGWGEEYTYQNNVQKYWKIANSWGQDWGENGYFRIVKGSDESEIESFVIAAWPVIERKLVRDKLSPFVRGKRGYLSNHIY